MKKRIKYKESSGNVFDDLGSENPEEALAKSELARQIAKPIKKINLHKNKLSRF